MRRLFSHLKRSPSLVQLFGPVKFGSLTRRRWASSFASMATMDSITYLDQTSMKRLDEHLMSEDVGFTLEQLMELAGLSVAQAVYDAFPPKAGKSTRVLVICGPGNNGGDGLVAARHLQHFGFAPTVLYPRQTDKEFFEKLVKQLSSNQVPLARDGEDIQPKRYDVVVDAIFGFSFYGQARPPFHNILQALASTDVPIVSVDIPSGWDVTAGPLTEDAIKPAVLVSLTAPKLCAKKFTGLHYVGGRFVPPSVAAKYNLRLPKYHGDRQIVKIS